MVLTSTSSRLRSSLVGFLWHAWTHIGLAGSVEGRESRAIDPEVLIVLTLRFGAQDPRLFDETLDWLTVNGRAISVQRLVNLTKDDDVDRTLVEAALSWAGAHESSLAGWARRHTSDVQAEIAPAPVRIKRADPILSRHGVRWPEILPSGNSSTPDLMDPAAFAFLLRSFFGVGTRSEIVRVMLTGPTGSLTAAQLARLTAFSKRNTQETLAALVEAGPVSTEPFDNGFRYTIHAAGWGEVLDLSTDQPWPRFFDWVSFRRVVSVLLAWAEMRTDANRSSYVLASDARAAIASLREDLPALGIRLGARSDVKGAEYLAVAEQIVQELIGLMQPDAGGGGHSEAL